MTRELTGRVSRWAVAVLFAGLSAAPIGAEERDIDFTRDIRPILSDRCFACHGPEEASREAELRFDVKEIAFGEAESGEIAIVPGDVDASEMIWRILSEDEDEHMPPPDVDKQLTEREISLLSRWIEQGAAWEEHWAFIAPTRPELPEVSDTHWCRTPIDYFILSRLDREGLSPATEADKETLIRRVTFDLTGLPPTLDEVDAFLADDSPDAYLRLVDRLLTSPSYGEHMARYWLDAARYADTHGLSVDNYREIWPYRDWVVRAFNDNMPFDQFAADQIAGDLQPNATRDQQVASGFNRCHMTTGEGGSIEEEFYTRNVVDRVVTTSTIFMAMTFDCTRCHDHKFDPITQRDFYSLFAFFNNLDGNAMDGNIKDHAPVVQVPGPDDEEELAQLETQIAQTQQEIDLLVANIDSVDPTIRDQLAELNEQIASANRRIEEMKGSWPTTLVFRERSQPKPAYILIRGEYDDHGEEVPRATPSVLPPMPEGAPLDRLGFAQWLLQPEHPLTARVQVNRYWQNLLGTGIVKTSEDFGSQGEPPSHPELLDWLAVQFVESGWDIQNTMRTIVMSSTYRQSSRMTPEMLALDPENRLLARGPRYRLDAEMIRDQALAASGLLVNQLGGPSVKPPQPDGLWFAVGYPDSNTLRFQADTSPERVHRRTLYTFIKRTAPPPQMNILDGPSRETCTVRRERSNTPLQALMLMNDPQFVEAARALAQRVVREGGNSPEQKADYMYRLCTSRHANEVRIAEQVSFYRDMLAAFQSDSEAAAQLIATGTSEPDADVAAAELAAWTMVANLVLNLDEVLNKN